MGLMFKKKIHLHYFRSVFTFISSLGLKLSLLHPLDKTSTNSTTGNQKHKLMDQNPFKPINQIHKSNI